LQALAIYARPCNFPTGVYFQGHPMPSVRNDSVTKLEQGVSRVRKGNLLQLVSWDTPCVPTLRRVYRLIRRGCFEVVLKHITPMTLRAMKAELWRNRSRNR